MSIRGIVRVGFAICIAISSHSMYECEARAYTIECGMVSSGGGVALPDGSMLFVGQMIIGTMSNSLYTMEIGIVACLMQAMTSTAATVGDDVCSGGSNNGDPCSVHTDCSGGMCGLKNRFITITLPAALNLERTIQVCIASISQFPARVGECWWAGPEITIPNAPNPSLIGAPLHCTSTPHAQVWTTAPLHLFGPPVIPGSTYEVRLCDETGSVCSDPLMVGTGKWGDVVAAFGAGQPDFSDVSALVSKFSAAVGSIDLPRADLIGSTQMDGSDLLNLNINFADISQVIGAFGGAAYPATVPACP